VMIGCDEQVCNHRTGIQTVDDGYAFHRRSSRAFSATFRLANASLVVRVRAKHLMVLATAA
jgi:hypothetical protein